MTEAFDQSMLREIPKLRSYARFLTGSGSEADDLVQDVLVRAWRFRDSYEPGTNLRAWMSRIMKNEFLTQRRRRGPWVEDIEGRLADHLACGPGQEWRLRCGELLEATRRLPVDNRMALLLVTAAGLSYREAAQLCGCEANVLKSRVRRARVKLAELTEAGPGEGPARPQPVRAEALRAAAAL